MKARAIAALQQATIQQYCQILRLPTVSAQFEKMAEEAGREQQSHLDYLEALLAARSVRIAISARYNAACVTRTCPG